MNLVEIILTLLTIRTAATRRPKAIPVHIPTAPICSVTKLVIDKIIPTINFLLSKNAKIIIISHVGRPKGKFKSELSLQPIRDNLSSQINENVKLEKANIFNLKKDELFKSADEKLIILENIRFYPEEENNNEKFSEHLAKLGDIYVNDAFSCSHREHASVTSITKFIPSYSGLQINSEVEASTSELI